ncbi:hypothetical protein C8Q79DRAFT_47748 [Trametes meyenii]|nr:hypothetical protein C8Q79DRAFT_47748 [Trametes meyenii]
MVVPRTPAGITAYGIAPQALLAASPSCARHPATVRRGGMLYRRARVGVRPRQTSNVDAVRRTSIPRPTALRPGLALSPQPWARTVRRGAAPVLEVLLITGVDEGRANRQTGAAATPYQYSAPSQYLAPGHAAGRPALHMHDQDREDHHAGVDGAADTGPRDGPTVNVADLPPAQHQHSFVCAGSMCTSESARGHTASTSHCCRSSYESKHPYARGRLGLSGSARQKHRGSNPFDLRPPRQLARPTTYRHRWTLLCRHTMLRRSRIFVCAKLYIQARAYPTGDSPVFRIGRSFKFERAYRTATVEPCSQTPKV